MTNLVPGLGIKQEAKKGAAPRVAPIFLYFWRFLGIMFIRGKDAIKIFYNADKGYFVE